MIEEGEQVSRSTIYKKLHGIIRVHSTKLKQISKVLGIIKRRYAWYFLKVGVLKDTQKINMNELQNFNFSGQDVRIITIVTNPGLFGRKDVAVFLVLIQEKHFQTM